jgi:excisionase family DNA binding protein
VSALLTSFLTPPQIAERLAVSEDTVLRWLANNELRGFRIGQKPNSKRPRWRVSEVDLLAFLERRSNGPRIEPQRRRRRATAAGVDYFP